MSETEIEYDAIEVKCTIERARNLSRELMIRGENTLVGEDAELSADALINYRDALLERRTRRHYGAVEQVVIATYVEGMADDLRKRRGPGLHFGPSASELIARALVVYADDLDEPPAPVKAAA